MGSRKIVTMQKMSGRRRRQCWLSDVLVLPQSMTLHGLDIDAVEQPVQLFGRQFQHRLGAPRPHEAILIQALHQQPEAGAVVDQQLDAVAAAITKGIGGACKGVKPQRFNNG